MPSSKRPEGFSQRGLGRNLVRRRNCLEVWTIRNQFQGKEPQEPNHHTESPRHWGVRYYGRVAHATERFQTSETVLQRWSRHHSPDRLEAGECFINAKVIVSSDRLLPSTVWA